MPQAKLPKAFKCGTHQYWEWTTASGMVYGKCQRCNDVVIIKDVRPVAPKQVDDAARHYLK